MCQKTLFHPTGPCCSGENALCNYFPRVDWSRSTWLVRMPRAKLATEFSWYQVLGEWRGARGERPSTGFSYVGSVPQYGPGPPILGDIVFGPVFGSSRAVHITGGEYIAEHTSPCRWNVRCKEPLCPGAFALARAENPSAPVPTWYVRADHVLNTATDPDFGDWDAFAYWQDFFGGTEFEIIATGGNNPDYYVSWRRVLKAAECSWIPTWSAQGWELTRGFFADGSIDGGLVAHLDAAADAIRNPRSLGYGFYKPTALDLAISWRLGFGFSFGVEADRRSPRFGEFTIREGGTYVEQEYGMPWMFSTPWVCETGEVVAEFGRVNRFVREDNNDTLPAWVEIELIPL